MDSLLGFYKRENKRENNLNPRINVPNLQTHGDFEENRLGNTARGLLDPNMVNIEATSIGDRLTACFSQYTANCDRLYTISCFTKLYC